MKRAIRRHQQQVAKVRRQNLYIHRWGMQWYLERLEGDWRGGRPWGPWKVTGRELMNEPGYWVTEMMIRPARVRSNQALRRVEQGLDWDLLHWPDYRKPYIYYW